MTTIPTPEPAECTCLVTAEHRLLDRDCPQHGTAADAARHRSWCEPTECTTSPDGQLVHRSAGEPFDFDLSRIWTASLLTVHLVERGEGEGIEVGVTIQGAISTSSATLIPEVAAELGGALLDHAERALGLSRSSGSSSPPATEVTALPPHGEVEQLAAELMAGQLDPAARERVARFIVSVGVHLRLAEGEAAEEQTRATERIAVSYRELLSA